MSRITQSISQLLMSFGPGARMDLPTRSVVVAGLDQWDSQRTAFRTIEEPRLTALLQAQLVDQRALVFRTTTAAEIAPDSAGDKSRSGSRWGRGSYISNLVHL